MLNIFTRIQNDIEFVCIGPLDSEDINTLLECSFWNRRLKEAVFEQIGEGHEIFLMIVGEEYSKDWHLGYGTCTDDGDPDVTPFCNIFRGYDDVYRR